MKWAKTAASTFFLGKISFEAQWSDCSTSGQSCRATISSSMGVCLRVNKSKWKREYFPLTFMLIKSVGLHFNFTSYLTYFWVNHTKWTWYLSLSLSFLYSVGIYVVRAFFPSKTRKRITCSVYLAAAKPWSAWFFMHNDIQSNSLYRHCSQFI